MYLWYNLDRLRTGSLLQDAGGNYCIALGFKNQYIDKNATMLVISCGDKKPLDFDEVAKYFSYTFGFYIIYSYRPLKVIKYDYFDEEDSKLFLLKYNLLNPDKNYVFQLSAKIVKGKNLKEGKIYQDFLTRFISVYPFFTVSGITLINTYTKEICYLEHVRDTEFLEVSEQYQKDFIANSLHK